LWLMPRKNGGRTATKDWGQDPKVVIWSQSPRSEGGDPGVENRDPIGGDLELRSEIRDPKSESSGLGATGARVSQFGTKGGATGLPGVCRRRARSRTFAACAEKCCSITLSHKTDIG
jgi:hypothetical protein